MTLLNKTNPDTYIVFWEASAAGGTQRDRKNLITNVFTGDWISYSGGVVLSFGMIDARTGTLVAPVVHRLMSPYTTIAAPPDSIANPIRHGSFEYHPMSAPVLEVRRVRDPHVSA